MFRSTTVRASIVALGAATAVLLTGGAANAAAPTTPVFGTTIDGYATYDEQTTCDPVAKPGTLGLRDLVLRQYPTTGDSGIVSDCDTAGVSEHKEGRAWDWTLNANNAADRARADEFVGWLFATDAHGNKFANARRLGIMYVIWNKQIWGAYRADEGWRPYSGESAHTDHMHFSLSWAGARKQTTWWTAVDQPASWPRAANGSSGVDVQSLQYLLNASGAALVADGKFGPGTEAAVKSFQGANNATADGIVGMMTWSKLLKQVKRGDVNDAVKAAQVQLNAVGYSLTVDGDFGPATASALNDYQTKHDLPADGVVSPTVWQLLIAGVG